MSTKHGRHEQGMTCWKSLFFGIDPDPDVDLRSVFPFLNIGRWPFYTIYDQSPQHNTSVALSALLIIYFHGFFALALF